MDPAAISQIVNRTASSFRKGGDPSQRKKYSERIWKQGEWILSEEISEAADISSRVIDYAGLAEVLNQTSVKGNVERATVAIAIFCSKELGESFRLDPEVLGRLCRGGCSLFVDVYSSPLER